MSTSTVAVLALLALGAGACGSDGGSGGGTSAAAPAASATPTAAAPIAVSLTDTGCDPVTLTAPAGEVTFVVDNARDAKAEFEILSATPKILTEEFLEPGASGSFTVTLAAGEYQVICGGPSDTRAALTVTGEGGAQQALTVDPAALDAATKAYTAYVDQQVDQLVAGTNELVDGRQGRRRRGGQGALRAGAPAVGADRARRRAVPRQRRGHRQPCRRLRAVRTTRSSPASTASRRACGRTAARTGSTRSPTSSRPTCSPSPPTSARCRSPRTSW